MVHFKEVVAILVDSEVADEEILVALEVAVGVILVALEVVAGEILVASEVEVDEEIRGAEVAREVVEETLEVVQGDEEILINQEGHLKETKDILESAIFLLLIYGIDRIKI